jgi:hypothetical protein
MRNTNELEPKQTKAEEMKAPTKLPYETPKLEDHGSVSLITKNFYGPGSDGGTYPYMSSVNV